MNSESWKSREMIRLILSIVLLIIGLILLGAPTFAMEVIVVIIGIVVLAYGIIQLLINLSKRNRGDANAGLAIPVIAIIIGILLIVFRGGVANVILPFIIGVWAIITGVMSLMEASQVKDFSTGAWKVALISGLAELVLGIIMIVGIIAGSNALGILLGVCLTIYGILSIVEWGIVASAKK
ncbi:DUF308 domain-containing protein [Christensenella intestinihominis]|uniref:DUF308 domain-containing protein n=1 Tax=Christensenella intestinihominis TaxID=1851429 RepID=UPI0008313E84|nr:DUF308 domain-containing protein [Christensenella intestinihominis]